MITERDAQAKQLLGHPNGTALRPNLVAKAKIELSKLTETSSTISPPAHRELMMHFASLPPENIVSVEEGGQPDSFFLHYKALCGLRTKRTENQPLLQKMPAPLPLLQLIEDLLLVYARAIFAYFAWQGRPCFIHVWDRDDSARGRNVDPRLCYLRIIHRLSAIGGTFTARWSAGLIRKEQVETIELSVRSMMVQMEALIEIGFGNEEVRMMEFTRIGYRSWRLIDGLVAHESFRSERLEKLLMGYLMSSGRKA
ncbi:hypothetical protein BJ508DRAFT_313212 [Ascobolus immersus RN42]|uniref:Uncharacterized protein n=1 Tax=Ascobolus immersus RN42 TaxID=1160509 RepID=A0A3N4HQK0_ASCIM|nr:hypothetical protein BJ508DRAFT_313212 [Ascobolus immersus RN42]